MIQKPNDHIALMSAEGEFCIDVDATSLRIIYNLIMQGGVQPNDFRNLSSMDILLLIKTAEYLVIKTIL